jgi:hypothetical protein
VIDEVNGGRRMEEEKEEGSLCSAGKTYRKFSGKRKEKVNENVKNNHDFKVKEIVRIIIILMLTNILEERSQQKLQKKTKNHGRDICRRASRAFLLPFHFVLNSFF